MSAHVFDPPPVPVVPVQGLDQTYPVRRIFCVGRNYAAHADEMGYEVDREAPFYFSKSAHCLQASGQTMAYPPGTRDLHYEMELVVALGAPAFRADASEAGQCVYGYACGLDMTRRDLQLAERERKRPWTLGKDFEQAAVVGEITPAARFAPLASRRIALSVNGQTRQDAVLGDLIHGVPEIIAHLSGYYHLGPGDLIFTGTPAGVGPVVAGDRIEGTIDGLAPVRLAIDPAR